MFERPENESPNQTESPHDENCICHEPLLSPQLRNIFTKICKMEHNVSVTLLARQTEQGFIEHYKPSEAVLKEMRRVLVAHDTYFNQTCYQCRVNAWRIKEHKEFERQGYKVDYKDDQPTIRRLPRIRIKKKLPL